MTQSKKLTIKQVIQESIKVWNDLVNHPEYVTKHALPYFAEMIKYPGFCSACAYTTQIDANCEECPIWGATGETCMPKYRNYDSGLMSERMEARQAILTDCINAAKRNHIAYKHLLKKSV